MKIVNSDYLTSAYLPEQIPEELHPEIAFIGSSNVGKSSLINTLLDRKNLAYTSKKPGKTRTINFFEVNQSFYFVDLPGYGFAKVSKSMREDWEKLVSSYLTNRPSLKLIILILDSRHGPKEADLDMLDYLLSFEKQILLTATKVDKLKGNKRRQRLKEMREDLDLGAEGELVPFSSVTGEGKNELLELIEELI